MTRTLVPTWSLGEPAWPPETPQWSSQLDEVHFSKETEHGIETKDDQQY
jgi:hypothetical protein